MGEFMLCRIFNCRNKNTLPKTSESTLNEDYTAPFNKQEKDLLDNWIKGEWIDLNLAAEI